MEKEKEDKKEKSNKINFKKIFVSAVSLLFVIGVIISLFFLFKLNSADKKNKLFRKETRSISWLITELKNNTVKKVVVRGIKMDIFLRDNNSAIVEKEENETFLGLLNNSFTKEKIAEIRSTVEIVNKKNGTLWDDFCGIFIACFAIFIFSFIFLWVFKKSNIIGGFGKSQAKKFDFKSEDKITFDNVGGNIEAKNALLDIIKFLKDPNKFQKLGARIPRGVLLIGDPGTGKTLMARAVAGEADVPFFHISGSEFVEMFVGVGAARVRDLFAKAKEASKSSPCIIFIDELDFFRSRDSSRKGLNNGGEKDQALNQLLTEMDGFESNSKIVIIGATNRPDVLDPALLRSGRFDRKVVVEIPDLEGRISILKAVAKNMVISQNIK